MKQENYEDIVYNLNLHIEKKSPKDHWDNSKTLFLQIFSYSTNGFDHFIAFNETVLWSSEENGRHFDETTNEYEDLENFVKKQFNAYLEEISRFKFRVKKLKTVEEE